jgi:signal transduction histidine kinase
MKLHVSLTLKIAILAGVTLLMLTSVLLIFAAVQFRISPENFIGAPAQNRIRSVAYEFGQDLGETPAAARVELLDRFSKEYGVNFYLVDGNGQSLTSAPLTLPQEVRDSITQRLNEDSNRRPPGPGRPGPGGGFAARATSVFRTKTDNPSQYWVGVPIRVRSPENPRPVTGVLVLNSDSFIGNQFFFDPKPWLALTGALTIVFVVVWLPLIRSLTHAVTEMTRATSQIAEGQFDTRLTIRRGDEVGQLAASINRMTTQLAGFVKGQKRFLADIAHELCAPIARMQMALGILEQRAEGNTKEYVADVRDEAQHMSELIDELMSFSKAGMQIGETEIVPVAVADTVQRVLEREGTTDAHIEASVMKDISVLANPDYLFRALSNLVRNAIRYAANAGPIMVSARNEGQETVITVADHGPGVPETALEEVFAPFYRLERARGRESGGTGLGLAIVKACVEACKGSVHAHNRKPSGLEVEIRLRTA